MNNESCIAFSLYTKEMGLNHSLIIQRPFSFRSFSVDQRYRGQGIGKRTLEILPAYIKQHYPRINEITLAVNTDNEKAINLYEQAGYRHTQDSELIGRPVYVMSLKI